MMFGSLFFVLLVGAGIWWFIQQQQQGNMGPRPPQQGDPAEIARMRYARGEISQQELQVILRTLQD